MSATGVMLKIPFIGEAFKLSACKLWTMVGQQLAGNPVDSKVNFHLLNYSFGRQIAESLHLEPSRVGVGVLHSIPIKYVCAYKGPWEIWDQVDKKWLFLLVGFDTVARLA